MGQNQSNQSPSKQYLEESTTSDDLLAPNEERQNKGITVVNPRPDANSYSANMKSVELQKLDRLHKFWPILRSTLEYEYPLETFEEGVSHQVLLALCTRYQSHLSISAQTVANEQKYLASRMKDIEMFSAGIVQQLARRHDKINKVLPHLQRVSELSEALQKIQSLLANCVPLMNRINNCLPERERLEHFSIHTSPTRQSSSPPSLEAGLTLSRHQADDREDDSESDKEYDPSEVHR